MLKAHELLSKIASDLDNTKKILLPQLSNKLSRISEEYSEDITIGNLNQIVKKMANSEKLFITRGELKSLYNQFYSKNTQFPKLFKDEIGELETLAKAPTYMEKTDNKPLEISKYADSYLLDTLNYMFNTSSYKTFSSKSEDQAKKVCVAIFNEMSLSPKTIKIASGQEDLLICEASFETPRGMTNVFLPVEISNQKALIPSVFVGNQGSADLTQANLTKYVTSNAGKNLKINPKVLLKAAASIKTPEKKFSDVEMAVVKMASKQNSEGMATNQILFQAVESPNKTTNISLPKYQDAEVTAFAAQLGSSTAAADSTLGKDKVALARSVVLRKLAEYGLPETQITVLNHTNSSLTFGVSAFNGKNAFKVLVNVKNGKVIEPKLAFHDGKVNELNKSFIQNLSKNDVFDHRVAAVTSPLHSLNPGDLVNTVELAMQEGNYAKAEDALNVLKQANDEKAYHIGFQIYSNGLMGIKSKEASKCKMMVKSASHQSMVCGHTNLPINKVYQDKFGDCHPLYRKAMENSNTASTGNFYLDLFRNKTTL